MNENYKPSCLCGECKPHNMLGMSAHKRLGFNSPNPCSRALYEQGHRSISDWACMYCTGNAEGWTHYEKCEQCIKEVVE